MAWCLIGCLASYIFFNFLLTFFLCCCCCSFTIFTGNCVKSDASIGARVLSSKAYVFQLRMGYCKVAQYITSFLYCVLLCPN